VLCPACQAENSAQNKFCGECGARLRLTCPACGQPNDPTQKFCGECGARLVAATAPPAQEAAPASSIVRSPPPATSAFRDAAPAAYTPKHLAEKILTSKGALEGERKTVSVMFSDVSGFTAMSERLDPEDVHAIMDRVFEVILAAVHGCEGTINQFLGDGVMALFGAPIAHEDHAQRALSAALAIQEGLRPVAADIKRVHGVDFSMRMGINTGPVVVGAIGRDLRMDYTAVGDTTNLAARLLAIAKPGQIVVSRRTQHLRDRSFTFEDLGDFEVKGKREPVRAYALTGEIRGRTRVEVSMERALTPLVGRTREIGALNQAFRRAMAGEGATVLVSGDAGVGKSRLLYEFLQELITPDFLELETTCPSYGRSLPYRPILELLRGYLRLSQTASPDEVRRRVAERLHDLGLEGEEPLILLAHFVGAMAPPEFVNRLSAAELKERTVAALAAVFLEASRKAPLILLIENVHWLDESSADFLSHLGPRLAGHRVLLLLSARPGLPSQLALPSSETVTIERLSGSEAAQMARTLLGTSTISPRLLDILAEKGEGNPLYVEEILLQLRETGELVVEEGEARLGNADVRVPPTIHDIIAARVDRLAESFKLTLQGAAVVGRRFGVPLVSRVIDVPGAGVSRHLTELHGLDFVFPSSSDPELMYSFKHALTQDVVYTGLLERRRRLYHAAAGRGLEELYRERIEEVFEFLAYHFGASAEDEKAVDYALRAAEKAQRQWANSEALAYFESALKRLDGMPDTTANRLRRIDAVVKQAEIKFALGRHADHVQALEAIRDLVEAVAEPPRRAAWYYWTGFLHSTTGARPEIAIAYCREAAAIAEAAGLDEIRASAECCLAQVYAYAGRLHEALEIGERALPVFQVGGNVWWACRTLWALSLTAIPLGEWAKSLDYCRQALEHAQAVNDRRLKVVGWWRTGWTHIQQGDAETGIRCCEHALALSPSPFDAAMTKAAQAYGLVKNGKVDVGIAMLTEAVEWFEKSRLPFTRAWFALWLADAYLFVGEASRAQALAEDVLPTVRDAGYRYFEGMAERLLGASLVTADPATAAQHLDVGRRILEEVGARNEVAKALVAEADLRRAARDLTGARERLARALAIFEALGTLDEPPRVRAALAALA
jgi:class 3 adenylate cyclase/tetratricopeptide (TPR) repeat protein